MSRDPDDGDDRFDIDFSRAFFSYRAPRTAQKSSGKKSSQQRARRKFISDNFPSKKNQREVHLRDRASPRPQGNMKRLIQEMVASDLNRTTDSIVAELEKQGYEASPTTVSTIKQEIIKVVRLCRKFGSINVPGWDN